MASWLVDTTVWLALLEEKHVLHPTIMAWWQALHEEDSILFCRSTRQSFLRLRTTDAVSAAYGLKPDTNVKAWQTFRTLLKDERIQLVEEPFSVELKWKALAAVGTASPKLWMDAYLAAFAITGSYGLVTTDKAFKQFKELDLLLLS